MRSACLLLIAMLTSCGLDDPSVDLHSYANTAEVRMTHVDLDLYVDFEARQLRGNCTLELKGPGDELVLDTRDLSIERVEVSDGSIRFEDTAFELGPADPILGAPLHIARGTAPTVRIWYSTGENASGLQWLEPAQTAGRAYPFLYTQSQAIHARSWIPLQDTPGARVTYSATIRTPPELLAVMSAEMHSGTERTGEYRFGMPLQIPSYLIALAVGDLAFRATGERSGVYAEPGVVEPAAQEFEDTEEMMQTAESLYGPYRWGRYDILVLPPAFPFGGMENPRLTFASPTVIAGDKSLVSLVAHELAHSWSGNLVTNATWRDFWLNEGFTVYIEERIQEAVYGPERAAMESALEVEGVKKDMAGMAEFKQVLHIDLAGKDPDQDGFSGVPYVKGAMFLRTIEEAVGREAFDAFLRAYFSEFAFRSITTPQFEDYLDTELLSKHPDARDAIPVREWLESPGLPANRHEPVSAALEVAEESAREWSTGTVSADQLDTGEWTTHHWLRFLRSMPADLGAERMIELDATFDFTNTGNAEILCEWLTLSVRHGYEQAEDALAAFLTSVGRRKFLEPLYLELVKTAQGRILATEIYHRAKAGYHPMAIASVDKIMNDAESAVQ